MDNSEELSVNLSNAMHAGNLFVEFLATSKGSVMFGFRIFLPSVTNLEGDKSKWFAWTRVEAVPAGLDFRVVESKRPFPKPLHIADCLDSESVRMYFQSQRGNLAILMEREHVIEVFQNISLLGEEQGLLEAQSNGLMILTNMRIIYLPNRMLQVPAELYGFYRQ